MLFNPSHNEYKNGTFNNSSTLFVYKNDVVINLPSPSGCTSEPTQDKLRGKIKGFSPRSRRRAVFVAQNSVGIISQFCCTYHHIETDGELVKKQLNHFLTILRKQFKNLKYYWFLEFQERGAPHYHFFTSLKSTKENHKFLVDAWLSASRQQNDKAAYDFHSHKSNFFDWELSGNYVRKYINKEAQKNVPSNYLFVGRFWGASRQLAHRMAEFVITAPMARVIKNYLLAKLKLANTTKYKTFSNLKKCKKMIISLNLDSIKTLLDFYGLPPLVLNLNNT